MAAHRSGNRNPLGLDGWVPDPKAPTLNESDNLLPRALRILGKGYEGRARRIYIHNLSLRVSSLSTHPSLEPVGLRVGYPTIRPLSLHEVRELRPTEDSDAFLSAILIPLDP